MQLNFKLEVPDRLRRYLANPTPYITDTMKKADKLALTLLQESIKTNAPRKSGELSRSIKIDIDERKVFSDSVKGRAIELGHYAVPISGKYLHFIDKGKDVFLKFTRSKKQPFFFRSISQNKIQLMEIYDDAFKKLLESI